MMDYEVFKNVVTERIKEYLPPVYGPFEVQRQKVPKINGTKEALIVEADFGSFRMAGPNLYFDDLYSQFKERGDLDVVMKAAGNIILNYTGVQSMEEDSWDLSAYQDRIIKILINTEKNEDLLEISPHKEFLDLSVVYRMMIEKGEGEGYAMAMVTEDLLEELGVGEDELDFLAEENNRRLLETSTMSLANGLLVLTSEKAMYGAVNLLREDVLRQAAEKLDDDMYILPTSLHEIIVTGAGGNSPELLRMMLKEGNACTIEEDEFLSDNIYFFERETGGISIVA